MKCYGPHLFFAFIHFCRGWRFFYTPGGTGRLVVKTWFLTPLAFSPSSSFSFSSSFFPLPPSSLPCLLPLLLLPLPPLPSLLPPPPPPPPDNHISSLCDTSYCPKVIVCPSLCSLRGECHKQGVRPSTSGLCHNRWKTKTAKEPTWIHDLFYFPYWLFARICIQ